MYVEIRKKFEKTLIKHQKKLLKNIKDPKIQDLTQTILSLGKLATLEAIDNDTTKKIMNELLGFRN